MEVKKELQDYIQAYIETWMYGGDVSNGDVSNRRPSAGSLPYDWEDYVQKGLFTTEKIYLEFLENNGLELFPDLIRTMATLQEHGRIIHLTDGNSRDVPFPPAFQAAFVKIAERHSVSDDLSKRKYLRNSLCTMLDLGMSRLHQSENNVDFYVLSIEEWIAFLDSVETGHFNVKSLELRENDFYRACVKAYGRSWVRIYYEEETLAESAHYCPQSESDTLKRYQNDWLHLLKHPPFNPNYY